MANKTQKALAKSVKSGSYQPSSIGAKARAAASKLKSVATGGKHRGMAKSETTATPRVGRHAKEAGLAGRHHASPAQSAAKNVRGSMNAPSTGRHSKEAHPNGNNVLTQKEAMSYRQASRAKPGVKLSQSEAMAANRSFTPSKQRAKRDMSRAA